MLVSRNKLSDHKLIMSLQALQYAAVIIQGLILMVNVLYDKCLQNVGFYSRYLNTHGELNILLLSVF